MKRSVSVLAGILLFGAVAYSQQPAISGVVNAATSDITQLARGSFISIYGQNFGPQAGPPSSLPLPTTLGSTQVTIKSGSTNYQAFLHFVSPGQINCILPSAVPAGLAFVTVTVNNVTSLPRNIQVAEHSFGIFTIGSEVGGMAIAQNFVSPTSVPLNLYTNPAGPGQTLILYGTGLGAYTNGPDGAAPQAGNIVNDALVMLNGYPITPFYAGRAPGIPGVDQINFTIPADAPIPDGCSLQMQIQIGSIGQNTVATIAKSSYAPVCQHTFGLGAAQLSALQSGATINAMTAQMIRSRGIIGVANGIEFGTLSESVAVLARTFNAAGSPYTYQNYPFALSQATGTCSEIALPGTVLDYVTNTDPGGSRDLSLGVLTLKGPAQSYTLQTLGQTKLYDGADIPGVSTAQSALVDGNWSLNTAGGTTVQPFNAPFTLQNQFRLVNVPASINRGQPLTMNWSGGANSDSDTVRFVVAGVALSGNAPTIICTAAAKDGTFTIPANLTSQLTAEVGGGLLVAVNTTTPATFTPPLVKSGNLDSGVLSFNIIEGFTGISIH